jgi:hypothetical protein
MKHEDTVYSMSRHGSVIYLNTFSETVKRYSISYHAWSSTLNMP